jgi:regulator of sigma E protease
LAILGDLVTGKLGIDSVGGPITTVKTIAVSTQTNLKNLILLFPLIAVNLAVFNLLPIPALDGARAVFVLIEWIFKKPVPRDIEGKIHGIGLMILFGLVILIDILHLFVF